MQFLKQLRARRTERSRRTAAPPANSEARRQADRCRDEGHWSEAAVWYRKHLDQHPDDVAIWVQAGNCLKDAASFDEALAAYRRAIVLDGSGDADVFLQLGHLQKLMGKREDAIEAYRTSLAREPRNNPALSELSALVGEVDQATISTNPIDLNRSLRAIENQLDRLIEASAAREADNPIVASSPTILPIPSSAQPPSTAPIPTEMVGKASDHTIFFLVDSNGSRDAEGSGFGRRLGRAFVEQNKSVLFVQWNTDAKQFQLLTKDELNHYATRLAESSASSPINAERRVIIEPASIGKTNWLLVPATVVMPDKPHLLEMDVIMECKRLGLRAAFIFHGADPLRLTKHAGRDADAQEQYMQALLLADVIIATSNLAAADLNAFFVQHQKADSVPLIKKISIPEEFRDDAANQWSDYVRRLQGVVTEVADETRHIKPLYYWIGPPASPSAEVVFARRLGHALTERGITLIPVVWDTAAKRLIAADGADLAHLTDGGGRSSSATWTDPGDAQSPGWVFYPYGVGAELVEEVSAFARTEGLRTAAILHEATDHPDERGTAGSLAHDRVLFEALVGIDKVFAVSERRFQEFHGFLLSWRGRLHSAEHRFKAVVAPNEVPQQIRRVTPQRPAPGVVRILVMVPLRPMDLGIMLDAAAEAAKRSTRRLIFALAGSPGAIPAAQCEILRAKVASIPEARWESEPDGERLDQLFDEADFVIYPGFEGEAAPAVVESLWRGLPCLVHVDATVSPVIPGPGLAGTDMRQRSELTEAILHLADDEWRRCLANEAIAQPVRSWDAYARKLAIELATDRLADGLHPVKLPIHGDIYATLINLTRRPKLSLCISTYNRAGWLGVNLRNIFAQVGTPRDDLEVMIVDNASIDSTAEVVKPYLNRTDFRYIRNQKNVGMLGNLAVTAQRAKGEYVWILGDDDLTRPGTIERVLQIIDRHPGIGLIYLNYGYTSEPDPASVGDIAAFLDAYNVLEPPGPDEFAPVKRLAAKSENFFTAIYCHVFRRDHAMKAYCQNTSGRLFSTMLACIPTAFYVLNYMTEEPGYWIGEPSLMVNSNVSWQDYGALLDLEQLPRAWDLAERMGADPGEVDRRRANRLWLVEMMWKEIFENDRAGNSAYFSASRVLMRLKHLPELDKHIDEFISIYQRARQAGHPAATSPAEELFSAFKSSLNGVGCSTDDALAVQ
jgi:glycosyltransferase involved in cell wall biosynthesis/tetratricopeptide (TPR) repeat protein